MITSPSSNLPDKKSVFLTVAQVAHYLSISSSTVRKLIDNGQLRAMRYQRTIRVKHTDLETLIQKYTTDVTEG